MSGLGLALVAALLAGASPLEAQSAPVPHRESPREPLDFRGPGREEPEPAVAEVVLGWFGPGDPVHPDFAEPWRGATLALEQENAGGGWQGKPFRLEPAWSASPWQAGILGVSRLVYERGAWAVIGGVDGTTTHLAVQLALKSHFLLVSPTSTDVTTDHANVPWLFSLPPADEAISRALQHAVGRVAAGGRIGILAGTDHDSRAALAGLRRALGGAVVASVVEIAPEQAPAVAAGRLLAGGARVVLVLAPSTRAGLCVAALRGAGFQGPILGGGTLGRAAFARAAGPSAEGVIAPLSGAGQGEPWQAFAVAYEQRWAGPPDGAAAQGYDAVRLVAAAIRAAGLNRARIRDAVRALAPWRGASGLVRWDALGRNDAAARLGRWRGGRLEGLNDDAGPGRGDGGVRVGYAQAEAP